MADDSASMRDMGMAVFAAGIRPCSGAILVLVFALSQKMLPLGIVAALIAAGIIGVWSGLNRLTASLSALQATVAAWTKVFEDRFVVVTETGQDHERRLGHVEGVVNLHEHRLLTVEEKCRSEHPWGNARK